MPSFDLVSKVDTGELKNAILQAQKEIESRYDFKGANAEIVLLETTIEIKASDESKVKAALEIIYTKLAKRGIGLKAIEAGDIVPTGFKLSKMVVELKQGIDKEQAKTINKIIKESGLKATSSTLEDKIRVNAKKIDDLQAVFQLLKTHKSVVCELQMENMKRD